MVTEAHPGFLVSVARRDTGVSTQPCAYVVSGQPHAHLVSGQPCALLVSGQVWTDISRLEHVYGMASRGWAVHQHGLADAVLEPRDVQTF